MTPVEFSESNIVIAADQPEYRPLPAHVDGSLEQRMTCCWRLTWRERLQVLITGRLWHQALTFRRPLQPQLLSTDKPEM